MQARLAYHELENRLRRVGDATLTERADAYVRSVRRRRIARTPTDRYGVVKAPILAEG